MNSSKPAWLRVLSHKNFRLMLGGVFLGHCGTWMQITAIGWFIYEATNDKSMLALFASAEMIPLALFGPLLGSISDHVDKKKLLIFCELIFVVLAFTGGCLVSISGIHPIYLAGLAFLEGINGAIEHAFGRRHRCSRQQGRCFVPGCHVWPRRNGPPSAERRRRRSFTKRGSYA